MPSLNNSLNPQAATAAAAIIPTSSAAAPSQNAPHDQSDKIAATRSFVCAVLVTA